MVLLHGKLKRLKQCLREFNRQHYSNISMRVKAMREELGKIQKVNLVGNSKGDLVQLERSKRMELYNLMRAEESFYNQK